MRLPYEGRVEMTRWLYDFRTISARCVVFGIRVPKLYKFTFLLVLSVGMTPKTVRVCVCVGGGGGGWKEVQKENADPS